MVSDLETLLWVASLTSWPVAQLLQAGAGPLHEIRTSSRNFYCTSSGNSQYGNQ